MHKIILHEVGPRDGLQMEKETVPLEFKIKWIQAGMDAGIDIVQVGSFVNPQKVPQMADTDKLCAHFMQPGMKPKAVILSALVLNEKGVDRGMACNVEMFCMGVSASETHSRKNTGMGISEALTRIIAMAKVVQAAGKKVQVSVQSAFGCGYEGAVPEGRVIEIVGRYLEAGVRAISLADTAGHATPDRVEKLFAALRQLDDQVECACHFHNTYGLGLANCYAAMRAGVGYFESAFAGLGGCPFTAVAGGNVCTEDLVHMLQHMNLRHDVKLEELTRIAADVSRFFKRELLGVVYNTGAIP